MIWSGFNEYPVVNGPRDDEDELPQLAMDTSRRIGGIKRETGTRKSHGSMKALGQILTHSICCASSQFDQALLLHR